MDLMVLFVYTRCETKKQNKREQTNDKQTDTKRDKTDNKVPTQQASPPPKPRDQGLCPGSGAVEDRPGAAADLSLAPD